jgi:NTE family protein
MLLPINWFRLASPFFHRSDLAAEYYDKHIFDGGTFGDIAARGTPIIINATNMTQGIRFGFDTEQFSWICSDLMQFPVSRAVAASSAVPIVLSPVTLKNYAGSCGYHPPQRLSDILQTQQLSSREYQQAASITSYLDSEEQPYIHLYDGGLSDNLGLRAVIDAVTLIGGAAQAFTSNKSLAQTQRVLLIVVNAQTALENRWAKSARGPSAIAVLNSAVSVPLNRYNFETISLLRSYFKEWVEQVAQSRCAKTNQATDKACKPLRFYLAEVSFEGLRDDSEKAYLTTLPTTVTLPSADIDRLKTAARRVLSDSEEFKMFLNDINKNQILTSPR